MLGLSFRLGPYSPAAAAIVAAHVLAPERTLSSGCCQRQCELSHCEALSPRLLQLPWWRMSPTLGKVAVGGKRERGRVDSTTGRGGSRIGRWQSSHRQQEAATSEKGGSPTMTEWQLPKESAVARGYIVSHNNNHCTRLQWVKRNWLVYLISQEWGWKPRL